MRHCSDIQYSEWGKTRTIESWERGRGIERWRKIEMEKDRKRESRSYPSIIRRTVERRKNARLEDQERESVSILIEGREGEGEIDR